MGFNIEYEREPQPCKVRKPKPKKLNLDKTIAELEAVLASAKTLLQVVKKMKRKEKQS
jgi:hypothetical protein